MVRATYCRFRNLVILDTQMQGASGTAKGTWSRGHSIKLIFIIVAANGGGSGEAVI